MTHTPGPWHLVEGDIHDHGEDGGGGFTITMGEYGKAGGKTIHCLHYAGDVYEDDKDYGKAAANACLIAAAPDLADFARSVAGLDDRLLTSADLNLIRATIREWRDEARAAIAKATNR